MMKANRIAPELLREISKYLSKYDCYNAMHVSCHWYNCLKDQFYKSVDIESTSQLDAFLHALDRSQADDNKGEEYSKLGYMVKELRLISYVASPRFTRLTQDKLNALGEFCPRLEVLEFNSSQWADVSNIAVFEKWKHLKSIAPIDCKYIHYVSFTPSLTKLHIIHRSPKEDQLFALLANMTFLKDLTLDIFCGQPRTYPGLDTDQFLKTLHTTVPQLESLCLTFAMFRYKAPSPDAMHHSRINLKSLSLKGITSPHNWFHYISKNYYLLENLEILDPIISKVNIHLQTDALFHLVQELSSLKKISLKGESVCYLYSDALIDEFSKPGCSVRQFEYSFYGFDLNKSTKFLDMIKACPPKQLQKLFIMVANQRFSWPGSLESLYQCKSLVDIDLCFARSYMDPYQYTDFVLDEFLLQFPRIKRLRLKQADVQLGGCDKKIGSLQNLDLKESRVLGIEELCQFINKQCISLSQLTLAQEKETVVLNLSNRRFDMVCLSYYKSSYRYRRITPCIENHPELNNFCWDNRVNAHHLTSMIELADLQENDFDSPATHAWIHCKSLQRLYVDREKLFFHPVHKDK
jgi:hypothetical protein